MKNSGLTILNCNTYSPFTTHLKVWAKDAYFYMIKGTH